MSADQLRKIQIQKLNHTFRDPALTEEERLKFVEKLTKLVTDFKVTTEKLSS
jgi:hypothetical protein